MRVARGQQGTGVGTGLAVLSAATVYPLLAALPDDCCSHRRLPGDLGERYIAAAAILMWGTGDGAAAMFVWALTVGFPVIWRVSGRSMKEGFLRAAGAALAGTFAELISKGGYDIVTGVEWCG